MRPAWRCVFSLFMTAALIALFARPSVAEERVTDTTAFTLEQGEVRVGFLRSGVGLATPKWLSGLEFSTYPLPWAALLADSDAFGVRVINGQIKGSRVFAVGLTGALALTALHGSVGNDEASATLVALPLEAYLNYDLSDRFSVGGLVQYTQVSISGRKNQGSEMEADDAGRYTAEAVLRTSTSHFGINTEFRAAGWLSLLGEARVTNFGRITGEASGAYSVDENTMVEGFGEASSKPYSFGFSVKGVAHLSLGWANLRVGLSYGNYVLPMLNLAVPVRHVVPTANLYFRI